jgi:hypothetical protein
MYCDVSPVPAPASVPQTKTEAESRKQIIESYKNKGVDLPIVTLEMVLDGVTGANDDVAPSKSVLPECKKKPGLFRRSAMSEPSDAGPCMGNLHQNKQKFIEALVAEKGSVSSKGNVCKALVQGNTIESTNDTLHQSDLLHCSQPLSSADNENIANSFSDATAIGTSLPDSSCSEDPCPILCCSRRQTVDCDSHYIKSNLQLPEGYEDKDDTQYQDIMNKGSLIDTDESVVTSNADYQDEMPHANGQVYKEDLLFWGSRRFHWTVMLCFLLHMVVISLIVVVALKARKNSHVVVPSHATVDGSKVSAMEGCVDALKLSATCYGVISNVLVNFRSCVPQTGDWIAVYEATEDATKLLYTDSYRWMYTCGSRNCEKAVFSNVVPFHAAALLTSATESSPMLKVHMMREGPGPFFTAFASSEEFRVVTDVQSC